MSVIPNKQIPKNDTIIIIGTSIPLTTQGAGIISLPTTMASITNMIAIFFIVHLTQALIDQLNVAHSNIELNCKILAKPHTKQLTS
jgi:hypothetical protein